MSELRDRTSARNTPSELLRVALDARQTEIHTSLKGEIVNYNATTKRADVQISPMRKHAEPIIGNDNGNVEIPVLLDMPVQQPSAGNLYLGFEPKAGDECMVLFSEREIESAKQVGGTYPLRYSRMHNLSDGVVVPFCISEGKARDLTENGVSLLQCFQDLAALVRNIALESTPSNALRAGEVLQLIQKIEDAR